MDATNSALVKLPSGAKNLIIGGMNDNTVLGGVRATESAGFAAANVIGIGINGTDAIGELKKPNSGFFGSMLPSPHIEGYNTAKMMFDWVTTGKEPPKYTAMDEVTLITRENFKQELEKSVCGTDGFPRRPRQRGRLIRVTRWLCTRKYRHTTPLPGCALTVSAKPFPGSRRWMASVSPPTLGRCTP